jgi:hypothetical protein
VHVERQDERILRKSYNKFKTEKKWAAKITRLIQHAIARGHLQRDDALLALGGAGDLIELESSTMR